MTLFDTVLMCYNNIIENCKPDRKTCPVFIFRNRREEIDTK